MGMLLAEILCLIYTYNNKVGTLLYSQPHEVCFQNEKIMNKNVYLNVLSMISYVIVCLSTMSIFALIKLK